MAAEGGKADIAKPMQRLGAGVFEIALSYVGNAFRVVYAVQIGTDLWVVHPFRKKATQGIKTPRHEVDLIRDRLRRLKEMLKRRTNNWMWFAAAVTCSAISGA